MAGIRDTHVLTGYFAKTMEVPNMQFSGKVRVMVLDTATMERSIIDASFPAGETYYVALKREHVSSKEQCLQLWFCNNIG